MIAHELIINDAGEVCVPVMEMPPIGLKSKAPFWYKNALMEYLTTAVKLKDQEWGWAYIDQEWGWACISTHMNRQHGSHPSGRYKRNYPHQVPEFEFEVVEEWTDSTDYDGKNWRSDRPPVIEHPSEVFRRKVAVIIDAKTPQP